VFRTLGVDPALEFGAAVERPRRRDPMTEHVVYPRRTDLCALVEDILGTRRVANQPVVFDAVRVAREIERCWRAVGSGEPIDRIELLRPIFYRNKGAYLVGRVAGGDHRLPLVIAMVPDERGPAVDAVLMSEDEASIVFSFTRAYFLVDIGSLAETIEFLRSIMPAKRVAELYIALGYNKLGKAEFYRDLMRHLAASSDRFEAAAGDRGMVMSVFTLPSYDVVFKVIRDRFAEPKTTSRRHVIDRYQLAFRHDRAGRLVDAQEYEHLALPRAHVRGAPRRAAGQRPVERRPRRGLRVVFRHVYLGSHWRRAVRKS
jgi:isocitrate dehydrogenase kinase/phosphatase